jgi:hypothetical protein
MQRRNHCHSNLEAVLIFLPPGQPGLRLGSWHERTRQRAGSRHREGCADALEPIGEARTLYREAVLSLDSGKVHEPLVWRRSSLKPKA